MERKADSTAVGQEFPGRKRKAERVVFFPGQKKQREAEKGGLGKREEPSQDLMPIMTAHQKFSSLFFFCLPILLNTLIVQGEVRVS